MPNEISIEGRITVDNSGDMRKTLSNVLHSKLRTLIVDVSQVSYIDSSGIATLLEALRTGRDKIIGGAGGPANRHDGLGRQCDGLLNC